MKRFSVGFAPVDRGDFAGGIGENSVVCRGKKENRNTTAAGIGARRCQYKFQKLRVRSDGTSELLVDRAVASKIVVGEKEEERRKFLAGGGFAHGGESIALHEASTRECLHNGLVTVTAGTLLRRGARRRCPVCSQRGLFRHWVRMVPECPRCGLVFGRVPGHWLGSWFLNICVVQLVVVLILIISVAATWPDPPMWIIGGATAASALVVPFVFFPYSRTIWTAIDLAMRPLDYDEGVAPGFVLDGDRAQLEIERSLGADEDRDV